MVLCMARPGRGRARPQNLSFCTWRGLSEAATISLELDCDRPVGDLGIIKLLNESHEASPAYPLKSCLARILGRKFSQVIGSNQTQQIQPNSRPSKNIAKHTFTTKRSFTGTDLKAVARQEEWRRDASCQSRYQAVWVLHVMASHLVQNCTSIDA